MAAIAPVSIGELLDLVRQSNILPPTRLKEVPGADALPADPRAAAAALIQQGFLTKFQCAQLLAGRHKGFRVGPYAIQDLLGRGGMGAVYLGEHLELRRKVAIKILAPVKGEGAHLAVERFLREGRATGAFDHPNIIRVFDVTRHQGTPCLVMEYVEGETLQQYVDREGAMPVTVAAECIAQAAAGLQHAHERGFIHRDIKPGNLIRSTDGVIKILDMGLARSGSDQDKLTEQLDHGAVVGTADFISPEQAINSPNTDGRADIYSLGATLYTLLAGKPPFDGNTTQKLMQHQLREPAPLADLRPNLPKALTEVVSRMLAKKPADRYQCGGEVVAALAPWTGNSARVAAALSRTNLGQSATLLDRVSRSSAALGAGLPPGAAESGVVDPSQVAHDTVELKSGQTIKDRPTPAPTAPRRRRALIAVLVVMLLLAAGIAGWLAAGGSSKHEQAKAPDPVPVPTPALPQAPTRPPAGAPKVTPSVEIKPLPASKAETRIAFDAASLNPFVDRIGLVSDSADANRKIARLLSHTGPGAVPSGWSGRGWHHDTEMELYAEAYEGKTALGLRNVTGPGSGMLFAPQFACPSGVVKVRLEYAAPVRSKAMTLKFKPDDQRQAWEVSRPAVGNGWRVEERVVDLKGASGGFFEIHNTDPNEPLFIASLSVRELDTASQDRTVFELNAAKLPEFRHTKLGRTTTSGQDAPRIPGVAFVGYKADTESEWVCGPVAGERAIGFSNVSDTVSAQIAIELEDPKGLGLSFAQGQLVRVRVTYRTAGNTRGALYFQTAADWKVFDRLELKPSNDAWTTVELVTVRGANPLRFLIDASDKGADNILYVKSVIVAEVGQSQSSEPTTSKKN